MKEKLIHFIRLFDPKKFLKFGIIGVLNTLVDFVVFYVMDRWVVGEGPTLVLLETTVATGLYISNAIAYAVANIHSFIWNKFWTFQKRDRVTRGEAARYLTTSAGYLLISSLSLAVFTQVLSAPFLAGVVPDHLVNVLAKLPTACITIFYNYLMNKFWVFRS